ncbi:hypothetical protein Amsp01_087970 [Amycolatopsis sp. NBRC 101858]|uniref:hypothetical protein n=1 Tax=Amycolatopsis sp. NBRC 101858 TaxID=3032200 RepID=UPI0024A1C214|nr:hypothetical protein [Amycolatopsis sp. NBRC 101858]GLY42774.1 hypothetical protein Amsp01_087970 [Amycolatopsis sp. NBRC 101858]
MFDYMEAIVIAAPVPAVRETLRSLEGDWRGPAAVTESSCSRPAQVLNRSSFARYRWLGVRVDVAECVTWSVERYGYAGTVVRAHVWAEFRAGLRARLLELAFSRLLGGVARDREHTRSELRHLKRMSEGPSRAGR